jgi:hypothetical protein
MKVEEGVGAELDLEFVRDRIPRMTIEQLRAMHRAQPFVPFDIHLADGRALTVAHPENLAFAGGGRCVGVGRSDGVIETVDLLLVTSLEPHGNGSPRRGRSRR